MGRQLEVVTQAAASTTFRCMVARGRGAATSRKRPLPPARHRKRGRSSSGCHPQRVKAHLTRRITGGNGMQQQTTQAVYQRLLREYYTFHDLLWQLLGTQKGREMGHRMALVMHHLDDLKPGWWKEPPPC